jgi:trehalose 6-phosphate synthase
MNLVAKEYVASQTPEDPGVLILSRFAGAARQMKEALIINPNSPEEISDALTRALNMDLDERKRRFESLIDNVTRHDVTAWRDDFVAQLREPVRPPALAKPDRAKPDRAKPDGAKLALAPPRALAVRAGGRA